MTDTPEDHPDEERTEEQRLLDGRQVPESAEWEVVGQVPFDGSTEGGLTTTIVYAIADAEGVRPRDIKEPPLYSVIDTAALEAAFFGPDGDSRTPTADCSTEFMYRGYRVKVQSDGWVFVYERAE